jgi:hypothetical protein
MRRVLVAVLDRGSAFELGPEFGRSLITALARLDGRPVGVLASDPEHYGGGLTAAASEKLARFVDLCDQFHLPVANFVDQPGFVIGTAAEREGTIRRGTRALFSVYQATVPWVRTPDLQRLRRLRGGCAALYAAVAARPTRAHALPRAGLAASEWLGAQAARRRVFLEPRLDGLLGWLDSGPLALALGHGVANLSGLSGDLGQHLLVGVARESPSELVQLGRELAWSAHTPSSLATWRGRAWPGSRRPTVGRTPPATLSSRSSNSSTPASANVAARKRMRA